MSMICPFCQQPLNLQEGRCLCCQHSIELQPICPECARPLQVLKACGAVDFFCTHGHGLISKKRVRYIAQQ
ncbi:MULTISPECIES: zinc ribbon domain-containing protein [Erwinia]|uniref:Zinc ribbon domain-containing protein n=1 Tax=Erwinia papayae TaxID=206499 RepID=A0ABV3MXQ6_9GAMM|nr:zinc ribbon domain-containing protein [Erwinia mallotivora]